jgi:hypothetical protein
MFGIMEALLSFVRRQVGLRTDNPDAEGSLHAKLNYMQGISPIKSIQRGTLIIGYASTSWTITISPVNMGKSMLNFLGAESQSAVRVDSNGSYTLTGHHFARINLESSSSIKASRFETGEVTGINSPVTISWEVIEFN